MYKVLYRPYPLLGASAAKEIHLLIAKESFRHLEDGPMDRA